MSQPQHHTIRVNGIRLSFVDAGAGPLVLMLHGFPETSDVWRHQVAALAAAGYRAVAPDLRGYGGSEVPSDEAAYTSLDVVGDLVALLDALDERDAVIVGGDWGATIAWQAAQIRPDRFRAVAALGVPLMGRAPLPPSKLFPKTHQAIFYTLHFSEPGVAEQEFERDVPLTLRKLYYAASGDAGARDDPATPNPFGMVDRQLGLLAGLPEPTCLPAWLPEADFANAVQHFESSGFQGGLNYYRNLDRNWALQAAFDGKRVEVPALFLVGERDPGRSMPGMDQIVAAMPALAADLRGVEVIPHAGHWLQQEAPEAVNQALLRFLNGIQQKP